MTATAPTRPATAGHAPALARDGVHDFDFLHGAWRIHNRRLRDGVGEFYSHEDYQGRMVFVRFRWRRAGPNAARWEQAFSADAGTTWETNWIMQFARTDGDDTGTTPDPTPAPAR